MDAEKEIGRNEKDDSQLGTHTLSGRSPLDHLGQCLGRAIDMPVRLTQSIPRMLNLLALTSQISQDVYAQVFGLESDAIRLFQATLTVLEGRCAMK